MNVLLITFSFPPAGGVGVLRALALAKYLPEFGVRVEVLTARNAPAVGRDLSLLQQVPGSVTVHRTWTLDLPFAMRKAVKKLLTRHSVPGGSASATPAPKRAGVLGKLRRLVANLLLPDPQIGWLPFAYPAARRIIRRRSIDAVIITVPPFSSVRLAARLRKEFPSLPIVVDFRDEWLTTTLSLVSFNSNSKARRVAEQTEAEAVRAATRVVLVTENAAHELRRRYPDQPAGKFLCIPNGYDAPVPTRGRPIAAVGRPVTLAYLGTVYGSTDPRPVLEALGQLDPAIRDRLRLQFVGRVETEAFREALAAWPGTVQMVGFVPQAEALRLLGEADYALLISHDPINVSAKFYDYLGAGLPIIAAVHPEGELARLMDVTGAGWWASIHDPQAICRLLEQAVDRARLGNATFSPAADAVAQFHRRPLAQRYAGLLHSLQPNSVRESRL